MQKKTLLCVDDEVTGLRIRKMLLEASGYDVLAADTPHGGLDLFRANPVDLAIVDYYMPIMNGTDLAAAMKSINPGIPILMLSAYINLPEGALDPVDAFITKGQSPEILLGTIRDLLQQR